MSRQNHKRMPYTRNPNPAHSVTPTKRNPNPQTTQLVGRKELIHAVSTPVFKSLPFEEVEDLVSQRQREVAYIRRCILPDLGDDGKPLAARNFLNMAPATGSHRKHFDELMNDESTRCFFVLGLSMGKLLEIENPRYCVNAISQLLEEFSYFTSSYASRSLRSTLGIKEFVITGDEPMTTGIFSQNGQVVFQFLDLPQVPQFCDRRTILHALLSIVYLIYERFLDVPEERFRKRLSLIDSKMAKLIFAPVVDILAALCKSETDAAFDDLLGSLNQLV